MGWPLYTYSSIRKSSRVKPDLYALYRGPLWSDITAWVWKPCGFAGHFIHHSNTYCGREATHCLFGVRASVPSVSPWWIATDWRGKALLNCKQPHISIFLLAFYWEKSYPNCDIEFFFFTVFIDEHGNLFYRNVPVSVRKTQVHL